jgi:hypothetical protein
MKSKAEKVNLEKGLRILARIIARTEMAGGCPGTQGNFCPNRLESNTRPRKESVSVNVSRRKSI